MLLQFYKYQGTGNDFVIIDNRKMQFDRSNTELVKRLCHRRFGIGADGLMLLQEKNGYDFEMVYYNSDGNESSMCGNGGRCIVEFARSLGLVNNKTLFVATDGEHEAFAQPGYVALKMKDVATVEHNKDYFYLNTGSPHYVAFVKDVADYDVYNTGKGIRYNERFKAVGTNVNFVEKQGNGLFVRTYERGVEDETYSCGTGVTAAAVVAASEGTATTQEYCDIHTLGGDLKVRFKRNADGSFSDIWLEGKATFVFKGEIEV